jgi:hypothetical protein
MKLREHVLLVAYSDPTEQPRRRLPLFEGCRGLVVCLDLVGESGRLLNRQLEVCWNIPLRESRNQDRACGRQPVFGLTA